MRVRRTVGFARAGHSDLPRWLWLGVCIVFCVGSPTFAGAETDITVAADGDGDFTSIQAALDSLPVAGREPVKILVRNGLYYEKVLINRDRVTLRGESRDGVQICYFLPRTEYDRRYDRLGPGVVNVFGNDVVIENLTIKNTQQSREHAFELYGQQKRLIPDH